MKLFLGVFFILIATAAVLGMKNNDARAKFINEVAFPADNTLYLANGLVEMRSAITKVEKYLTQVQRTLQNSEWITKLNAILKNNIVVMYYLIHPVSHLNEPFDKWSKDLANFGFVKGFDMKLANRISSIVEFPSDFTIFVNDTFLNGYFDYSKIINKNTRLDSEQLRKLNQVLDVTVENSNRYKSKIMDSRSQFGDFIKEFKYSTSNLHQKLKELYNAISNGQEESKNMSELKNVINISEKEIKRGGEKCSNEFKMIKYNVELMQASQKDLPKIIEDIITNNVMLYEIQTNKERIKEVVRKFPPF